MDLKLMRFFSGGGGGGGGRRGFPKVIFAWDIIRSIDWKKKVGKKARVHEMPFETGPQSN
jgi:hypothetical protein